MFLRPANLLSKGTAGLLLLASKVMADDTDGQDANDLGNQIALGFGATFIIGVACFVCCWLRRAPIGQANNNYYGLAEQLQDIRIADQQAARAGTYNP